MAIDCKFFLVFLHGKARRHAAQSGTRGAYRATGQGLGKGYTKPDPRHKYNSGAKGMHVLAGMGGMARFSCGSSSRDHGTAMKPSGCVRARCAEPSSAPTPTAADSISWKTTTLAGSRVRRGVAAKSVSKISAFHIPPHSPDLNPCDFSLWKTVNRRMRSQEKAGPFDDVDNEGGVVCSSVDATRAARAQRRGP